MNFAPDTFESVHRRKKLAAWLATLKGPAKPERIYADALNQTRGISGGAGRWIEDGMSGLAGSGGTGMFCINIVRAAD